jgi:hypothetical protein
MVRKFSPSRPQSKGINMSTFQLGLATADTEEMCRNNGALPGSPTRDIVDSFDGATSFIEHIQKSKIDRPHCFSAEPVEQPKNHPATTNLTAQAAYFKEHGEAATLALLSDAGLKLGQIKPAAKDDGEMAASNNPYSDGFKGDREARIASIIKSGGTRLASSLAKSAGKTIDNKPLQAVGAARR